MSETTPNPNPPPEVQVALPPLEYQYRAPAIVEKRRNKCTLAKCILAISIMELIFYFGVLILFTVGLTLFKDYPKLSTSSEVAYWLRSIVMGFAVAYMTFAVILMIGVLKKNPFLLKLWIFGVFTVMVLEWISAIVAVALVMNGALFFISGSYGPLRLCFICLTGMYGQRLKWGRQGDFLPVMQELAEGEGYEVNSDTAIFMQPEGNTDSETLRFNIHLPATSSHSII